MDGVHGEPVSSFEGGPASHRRSVGRIQREFAQKALPAAIGEGDLLELLQIGAYEDPHSRKAARSEDRKKTGSVRYPTLRFHRCSSWRATRSGSLVSSARLARERGREPLSMK